MNDPTRLLALVHVLSLDIQKCALTFRSRQRIELERGLAQHTAYCRKLQEKGLQVIELTVNRDHPDGVFIEDTAVVLDETAIMGRMGIASRQPEVAGIASVLARYRPLATLPSGATLEGGDVVIVGREIIIGLSRRTNQVGAESLRDIAVPLGYAVRVVPITGCLHLKSACTALDKNTLLVNPNWVPVDSLTGFQVLPVPAGEPDAANTLRLGQVVVVPACHQETAAFLRSRGYQVETLDMNELMKAEGGLTCCSLVFPRKVAPPEPGPARNPAGP